MKFETRNQLEEMIKLLEARENKDFETLLKLSTMNELVEKQHLINKEIVARSCIEV